MKRRNRNLLPAALLCGLVLVFLSGCKKDNTEENTAQNPPEINTSSITDITHNSATGGGEVTSEGSASVTARGICWSTQQGPTVDNPRTLDGGGAGSFASNMSSLTPGTTYYVRAYATNSLGTSYGVQVSFATDNAPPCPGTPTVTYEGKTYSTVLIGTQCWMAENLDVGTMISGDQSQTDNGVLEKYCFGDNPAHCESYGGLYQWDEMMQYVTAGGAQGICPPGWHIPDNIEWIALADYLGGLEVAGGKVKQEGFAHWSPPNTGATNESGFAGLPGGFRAADGIFYSKGVEGAFWSSTLIDPYQAWFRYLYYNNSLLEVSNNFLESGFSVRCIKD